MARSTLICRLLRPSVSALATSALAVCTLLFSPSPPAALGQTPSQSTSQTSSQTTAQTNSQTAHLAGTVVNGVTGKPIARALVASTDNRLATLTNSEGRFSFDVALSGRAATPGAGTVNFFSSPFADAVVLRVQKPGYLPDEDVTAITLSATAAPEIELRLMPAAVIAGRVSATTTDRAANVAVFLYKHQVEDGTRHWMQIGAQDTNSRGGFRFADLRPGEYTVATAEWRGDRPISPERSAVTEQYPPVFLGDTPGLTPAGTLHLHFGDTAAADLHLRLATYYPVAIPIRSAEPIPWVNAEIHGADDLSRYQLSYNAREHELSGALPSGRYTLTLSAPPPSSTALLPLQVANAPLRTAPVTLAPAGSVTVRVHRDFSHTESTEFSVNVNLRSETPGRNFAGGGNQPGNRDEFPLSNTYPGRFHVNINCSPGYVSAATSGGTDLLRDPLVIGSNGTADPIDVTLRDDGATVTGTVHSTSGPTPAHSFILLLPSGSSAGYMEGYAGPDGNFSMGNVPPGSYRLLAFRSHPVSIAFRDPEAMRAFEGRGTTVTATPAATAHSDVTVEDSMPEEQ